MRTLAGTRTFILLAICGVFGCVNSIEETATEIDTERDEVLTVHVVNYPLAYFAERIGGEHVAVVFPAPRSEDPAYWRPDLETITAFQQADIILLNGASYAKWAEVVSLPHSKTVNTSASSAEQYIQTDGAVTHSHGPGGEHAHGETAFTTWLDPQLAISQANSICEALIKRCPEHSDAFEANFAALESDLKQLDTDIADAVDGKQDRAVFFSHPVYQYLQQRYDLNGRSVHWEPDSVLNPKQWDEFHAVTKQHPAQWMIWEAEPIKETAQKLSDAGIASVVFSPCANIPAEGDFLHVMRQNIEAIERIFAD